MKKENKKVGAGVGIMVLKDNKILLGKRHTDPKKADSELRGEGTWCMPGGKLHFGETLEEGARREVYEETGIRLRKVKFLCVNNDKNEHAHFVTVGMISDDFEGEPSTMEPEEIVEWRWFSIDNLPDPVFPSSMKMINNYRNKLPYIPEVV